MGELHCQNKAVPILSPEAPLFPAKLADLVNSPSHYSRLSPEPLDVLLKWGLGFPESNAVKYLCRAGYKGGSDTRIQDLKKARTYIDRLIQFEESKVK
jgi:hypothetical protein